MLPPLGSRVATYLVFAALVVVWDIVAGGRMLRNRRLPPVLAWMTALGALLLAPALLIAISAASLVYGRAMQPVAWVWPAVTLLFAGQAALALARGAVNPVLGVPILTYDVIIATVAVARFLSTRGGEPPVLTLVLSAAQSSALGIVGGRAALEQATWLLVPMFAPVLPSFSRLKVAIRWVLGAAVAGVAALVLLETPAAAESIGSYARYERAALLERPGGPLAFGLKVFPDLRGAPPAAAIQNDLPLADTLAVDAISVVVDPEAARGRALDSLARTLDAVRGDSTIVVVTLGYPLDARARFTRDSARYLRDRLADVNRLTRALRPTIFIPAAEPYGEGARALGLRPAEFWAGYITRAARIAHYVNPNTRVATEASSYGARDSALYAWAAARGSPVNIAGFSFMPGFDGATSLDTHLRIAQRWMLAQAQPKRAWVFRAGGYPVAHGERSQLLALRGVLAWASAQPAVAGVVAVQAGDYTEQTGLRAPAGRLRPAFGELLRAVTATREGAAASP